MPYTRVTVTNRPVSVHRIASLLRNRTAHSSTTSRRCRVRPSPGIRFTTDPRVPKCPTCSNRTFAGRVQDRGHPREFSRGRARVRGLLLLLPRISQQLRLSGIVERRLFVEVRLQPRPCSECTSHRARQSGLPKTGIACAPDVSTSQQRGTQRSRSACWRANLIRMHSRHRPSIGGDGAEPLVPE